MLQRETPSHVRPRFVRFAVGSCCLSAGAILVAAANLRPEPPERPARVEVPPAVVAAPPPAAAPVIVHVPAIVPLPAAATRFPCAPPPAKPPRYFGRPFVVDEEQTWRNDVEDVAASPVDDGRLAVWTDDEVRLSEDDGRTFAQVLDGPGEVHAVTIDCGGRVWAVRAQGLLGVRDGGVETWRRLPFDVAGAEGDESYEGVHVLLASGGGWIAVSAHGLHDSTTIAFSRDGGETWRFDEVGMADHDLEVRIDGDGAVVAIASWTDCMGEGVDLFGGPALTGLRALPEAGPEEDGLPWQAVIAHDGWIYQPRCALADPVCAWAPLGGARKISVEKTRADDVLEDEVWIGSPIIGPDVTYAFVDGQLARLSRGRLKLYDYPLAAEEARVADARGRVLGVTEGRLVRWSPSTGARFIPGAAAAE